MEPLLLNQFEVGQLYVALGTKGLGQLSPELRRKLKSVWETSRANTVEVVPVKLDKDVYFYATDEPRP